MHRTGNHRRVSLSAVSLAVSFVFCSTQVHAQAKTSSETPASASALSLSQSTVPGATDGANTGTATNTASSQSLLSSILGTSTDLTVGLGAGIDQRYMGAKTYHAVLVPMISASRGIFFVDTVRGAGVQYLSPSGFYIGDGLNYDSGRDTRNSLWRTGSGNLKGMGSVKGTITNTVTVSQQIFPWLSANAQAEFGLDGSRGNQYQVGLESVAYQNPKDSLTLDLDAKIGDGTYNRTYFGVTPSQSARSGYGRFRPGFGVYAYTLTATWKHSFDKHWSTQVFLTGTLYTSKVADSPIVQRGYGLTLLPVLNYSF